MNQKLIEDLKHLSNSINELSEAITNGYKLLKVYRKANHAGTSNENVLSSIIKDLELRRSQYKSIGSKKLRELLNSVSCNCPTLVDKGCFSSKEIEEGYVVLGDGERVLLLSGELIPLSEAYNEEN